MNPNFSLIYMKALFLLATFIEQKQNKRNKLNIYIVSTF